MSSNKENRTAASNYRKPPVEHQFKKSTSGNPKGRPPKKKAVQPGFGALGGGIADRLGAMALDEAGRPVTVREGERIAATSPRAATCRLRGPRIERRARPAHAYDRAGRFVRSICSAATK